jgi:hypothetical protein
MVIIEMLISICPKMIGGFLIKFDNSFAIKALDYVFEWLQKPINKRASWGNCPRGLNEDVDGSSAK